jgi:hypothetical protein
VALREVVLRPAGPPAVAVISAGCQADVAAGGTAGTKSAWAAAGIATGATAVWVAVGGTAGIAAGVAALLVAVCPPARASAAGVRSSGRTVAPVAGPEPVTTSVMVGVAGVSAATVRRRAGLAPVERRVTGSPPVAFRATAMSLPPCVL